MRNKLKFSNYLTFIKNLLQSGYRIDIERENDGFYNFTLDKT